MKRRTLLWLLGLALLVAVSTGGLAIAAGGSAKTVLVKKAFNKKLNKWIFVTGSGMTLYENTAERKGKIRCTGSCRTAWPPLLVPAGGKPAAGAGVSQSKLGTLKRPDSGTQVTYTGVPLYRFTSDRKAGDATGQGVKDLGGTWSAAVPTSSNTPPPPAPPPPTTTTPPTTTGGGYGY